MHKNPIKKTTVNSKYLAKYIVYFVVFIAVRSLACAIWEGLREEERARALSHTSHDQNNNDAY